MANEDALKDGNRIPTLLFEQSGEIKRVSPINPMPVAVMGGDTAVLQTAAFERIGPGEVVLATPSAGKRIVVRGLVINMETATGGEADIRFVTTNKLICKIYRGDQSGSYVQANSKGNVGEAVKAVISGGAGGAKSFYLVNYVEE